MVSVLQNMNKDSGLEQDYIDEGHKERHKLKKDLVALKVSSDNDAVTRYLRNHWPEMWTKVCAMINSCIAVKP